MSLFVRHWPTRLADCRALGALLTTLLVASPSFSQTTEDKATAEALFDQALELLKAEKLEQACDRFEQSQRVDPAVGTLLYLAECYERTGRFASAWATFREAASGAAASGQAERAQIGSDRADKLEPLLSTVTYLVSTNAQLDGFVLTQDGKPIRSVVFGVPIPLDPGDHVMHAEAPGHEPWDMQVTVPKAASTVEITVPPLQPSPTPVAEPTPPPTAPVEAPPEPPAPNDEAAPAGSGDTWVWVAAGVGAVGIGVGVGFGIKAAGHDDEAEKFCSDAVCFDRRGEEESQNAQDAALISNIGYGVGALGLLTSLILAVVSVDDAAADASAWQLAPRVGSAGGGIDLRGSF